MLEYDGEPDKPAPHGAYGENLSRKLHSIPVLLKFLYIFSLLHLANSYSSKILGFFFIAISRCCVYNTVLYFHWRKTEEVQIIQLLQRYCIICEPIFLDHAFPRQTEFMSSTKFRVNIVVF